MKAPNAILVIFHCSTNNGYSIKLWEQVFWDMAHRLVGSHDRIHFSYASMSGGAPRNLPEKCQVLHFDPADDSAESLRKIADYIRQHGIDLAFGFDQPVRRPSYRALRSAGIRKFVSYWGAPISDYYQGWKLLARRLEVRLARHQPDSYIFQCKAMADQAVNGRGLRRSRVRICESGIDHQRFHPAPSRTQYAHEAFGIPQQRRIIYYSGHFEERKGVAVLIRTAIELVDKRKRTDVHFLLLGNKGDGAQPYQQMLSGTAAQSHVTFGGYRNDTAELLQSAYIGTLPTTGWDSFPVSGMEMASAGLPMLVSRLQGLPEMIEAGVTGESFPKGDHVALADNIERLLNDPELCASYSKAARARIEGFFTQQHVTDRISRAVAEVWAEE